VLPNCVTVQRTLASSCSWRCSIVVAVIFSLTTAIVPLAAESLNEASGPPSATPATDDKPTGTIPESTTKIVAQPPPVKEKVTWRNFPVSVLKDQQLIWSSPFRMSRSDAKWWLTFGVVSAAAVASDRWTSKQLPNSNDQIAAAKWSSRLGASYTLIPMATLFYFYGKAFNSPQARETGRLGAISIINTSVVVEVLKAVTQRARPTEGDQKGTGFFEGGDSFPSGHSIYSWSLASIIAHEYPHPRIIPILVYLGAGTVSASRFAARKHYASDTIVGSAAGWFIGDFVYRKHHDPGLEKQGGVGNWLARHVQPGFEYMTPQQTVQRYILPRGALLQATP
jgi:membrane-associated phospholipid phosphatase